MIYFFKRKNDGSTFPIEGEDAAGRLFQRRNFKDLFEYLGKSDGSAFNAVLKGAAKITKAEQQAVMEGSKEDDETRVALLKRAEQAELEAALANPDKRRPVTSSVLDLDGRAVNSGPIAEMAKMFGQR